MTTEKNLTWNEQTKFLMTENGDRYCYIDHHDPMRNFNQKSYFSDFETEIHFYEEEEPHLLNEDQYCAYYKEHVARHYPAPATTIDLIGLRFYHDKLQVLLVKRRHYPSRDRWAMPGGFLDYEETINHACLREVKEETNIDLNDDNIIRLTNVSAKGRDKRMWVITTPNIVLFSPNDLKYMNVKAGDDAKEAKWFDLKLTADANFKPHNLYSYTKKDLQHLHLSIPDAMPLAFDHYDIIQSALRQLVLDFGRIQLPQIVKLLGDEVTTKDLINLFSQLVPNFKNVGATNLARHYHRDLIATRKVRKMPKGSAGGNSMRIYKVRKY